MSNKITLNEHAGRSHDNCSCHCTHRSVSLMTGAGNNHIALPGETELVAAVWQQLEMHPGEVHPLNLAALTGQPSSKTGQGGAHMHMAEGLRLALQAGRLDAILAQRFDNMEGAIKWALKHKPTFAPICGSLLQEIQRVKVFYGQTLPRVITLVAAKNPNVPPLETALQLLEQQLDNVLSVLGIWGQAFAQEMFGTYPQQHIVTFQAEATHRLFTTGGDTPHAGLPTEIFAVGNRFATVFDGSGPAIIPGRGPLGGHLLIAPFDELRMLGCMLTLFNHEFAHAFLADVIGLFQELTDRLTSQVKAHRFAPAETTVKFGENDFDKQAVILNMLLESLGEIGADIVGGILLSGPAYLQCMLTSFAAFNSREHVYQEPQPLRSTSCFTINEQSLDFCPHPPDILRALICGEALRQLGFTKQAQDLTDAAYRLSGGVPSDLIWRDDNRQTNETITLPLAEVLEFVPSLVQLLIKTPLTALKNQAFFNIVNWNDKREEKAELIAAAMAQGATVAPSNIGDIWPTYISAAGVKHCYALIANLANPLDAVYKTSAQTLAMIEHLRQQQLAT